MKTGELGPREQRLLSLGGFFPVAVARNRHDRWLDVPISSKGQALASVPTFRPQPGPPQDHHHPAPVGSAWCRSPFRPPGASPRPGPGCRTRRGRRTPPRRPETTIVAGERHVTKEPGAPAVDRMAPDLLIAFQADPEAYREDNGYVISVQMCPRSVGRRWRSVRHWRSGSGYRLWRMAWKVISSDSLSQTTHLSPNPIGWDMPWTSQATLDFVFPAGQPVEEIPDPLLYQGLGSQAQVPGRFLSHPAPDRLIGASVRAVARQSLPS